MFTQCTIVYYYIFIHTDDMKYREEAEEKKKKHMIDLHFRTQRTYKVIS
jgi:hypothetical protein